MSCVACLRGWCLISAANSNRRLSRQLHSTHTRTVQRNYYDTLGLTPKASQGDIKQAYYKLSLKYHPDISEGETEKFREITAAYEVLGNLKLRRLYDRGALQLGHGPAPSETVRESPHINTANFEARRQRSPSTGRTAEFNFDDWSKEHYGRMFQREEAMRRRVAAKKHAQNAVSHHGNMGNLLILGIFFLCMTVGISVMHGSTQYDVPRKKSNDKDR